jgi:sugar phosphate isomerase/epimerase
VKKLGISCKPLIRLYGIERGLEICKESGFDAVDYGLTHYKLGESVFGDSEDAFEAHFDAIRKKAKSLELEISQTHGRCDASQPRDEAYGEWSDKVGELCLRATALLGAPSCVIHFPSSSNWGKQSAEFMHQLSSRMYDNLVPIAENCQVNIAMETFGAAKIKGERIRDFFADPVEFKRQYDRLNTRYKTICVDTGHTHEAGSFWVPAPEEMIRILGKDVSILHLHDNSGHWDDHLLPGMGSIHWPGVFDALEEIGYNGVYNFELTTKFAGKMMEEYVQFAGKYLRSFVDNHGDLSKK